MTRFKHWAGMVLAVTSSILSTCSAWAGQCGFEPAFERDDEGGTATVQVYQGKQVPTLGNKRPLLFITFMKVNTDGTKISYHQDDVTGDRCEADSTKTPCAINKISNAFNDHTKPISDFTKVRDANYPNDRTWEVLNPDIIEKNEKTQKPCLSSDGYLVSMTARRATDIGKQGDCNQDKWIDALSVPAVVIPKKSEFFDFGVAVLDLVVAASPSATKRIVPGIVGDTGPVKEIGEATVAMNRALNGMKKTEVPKYRKDAIRRFQAGRTAVLIFPGLTMPRPITADRVAQVGADVLTKFGGATKLYGCIRDEIDKRF